MTGTRSFKRPESQLTALETQTISDSAAGLTYKEIARHHGVTLSTIHMRMERTRDKLGARNKTHAVILWILTQ
jgi:DNA-binding CsgD family transcriptional regulator